MSRPLTGWQISQRWVPPRRGRESARQPIVAHDAGRSYARLYENLRRGDSHRFIEEAIAKSGGRIGLSSGPSQGPLFLGGEDASGRAFALCVYAFTATGRRIKNRPADEHRFQIRYGSEAHWHTDTHQLGFDPLGSDTTLVLGVHEEAGILIGVDPLIYDPLPMGISIFFKASDVDEARANRWHVWERDNIAESQRGDPRSPAGLETLVSFGSERLLEYVEFERTAQRLGLDPALRYAAAQKAAISGDVSSLHALETQFGLTSKEILDIIEERPRLGVAVRGGVAERHLHKALEDDRFVSNIELGNAEGPPDLIVDISGVTRRISIECKNASPKTYADGTPKVETQKTRASKGDPKSRLYAPSQFDLLAACMFGPTGRWEFRYKRSDRLVRDSQFEDRIAPIQKVDDSWVGSPLEAIRETQHH